MLFLAAVQVVHLCLWYEQCDAVLCFFKKKKKFLHRKIENIKRKHWDRYIKNVLYQWGDLFFIKINTGQVGYA